MLVGAPLLYCHSGLRIGRPSPDCRHCTAGMIVEQWGALPGGGRPGGPTLGGGRDGTNRCLFGAATARGTEPCLGPERTAAATTAPASQRRALAPPDVVIEARCSSAHVGKAEVQPPSAAGKRRSERARYRQRARSSSGRWSPGRTGGNRHGEGEDEDSHREELSTARLVGDVDTVDDEEGAHHDRPEPVTDRLPQQQGKQGSAGLRSERSRWCNRPSSSAEASVHRGRYQSISGSVFRRRIRVSQLPQKTAGVRSTVSPHGQRRWSGSPWMRSKSCASLLEEPQPSQRHAQTTRSTSTVTSPRSAFSGSRIRRGLHSGQ